MDGGGREQLRGRRATCLPLFLVAAPVLGGACGLAPLGGGSLPLNLTDVQSRTLVVRIQAPTGARVYEVQGSSETELGQGAVTVERYVIQRVTFGPGLAVGLFLCARPCSEPTESYQVAYSPDQLFAGDGELRLQFRMVRTDGTSQELHHTVGPQMLPELWTRPVIEIAPAGGERREAGTPLSP